MAILTREQLLAASDLQEKEIDLPSIGGSVRIRSLPAEYSNAALSRAVTVTQGPKGEAMMTTDNGLLELVKVQHGLVEPKLESLAAVRTFAQNCGPAFKAIVKAIDDISGLTKEAATATAATFPNGGGSPGGGQGDAPSAGGGGSDLHARAGA